MKTRDTIEQLSLPSIFEGQIVLNPEVQIKQEFSKRGDYVVENLRCSIALIFTMIDDLFRKKVLETQFPIVYLTFSMFKRIASVLIALLAVVPITSDAGVFKPGSPSRVTSSAVTIRWETSDESGVQKFHVYRREYQSGGMGGWYLVRSIDAKRVNGSIYVVDDTEIFKSADRILEYEIRAFDKDEKFLDSAKMTTIFSTGLTSAAKRTWGSIKAMFR